MTATGNILAGMALTAAMAQGIAPLAAYKSANQTVTDSATLVNDDALVLALSANAVYFFALIFAYEAPAANDLSGGFTVPAESTITAGVVHYGGSDTYALSYYSGGVNVYYGAGASTPAAGIMIGTVATSTTPGNMQWQFAQQSAAASTSAIMLAGAALAAWQVQ
jgi:hypothetical protein